MKNILFLLAASFFSVGVVNAQSSFGIKSGLNFPKLKSSQDNMSYTSDVSTNLYISGYANFFLSSNFSIQPGISLQGKGGNFDADDTDLGQAIKMNLMSFEVPLNFVYYIPASNNGSVFFGGGPYVGFNFKGKYESGGFSKELTIGSEVDDVKVIDYGANFQGGYKFSSGFLINASYGLGLGNLNNYSETKTTNKVVSLGIGYEF